MSAAIPDAAVAKDQPAPAAPTPATPAPVPAVQTVTAPPAPVAPPVETPRPVPGITAPDLAAKVKELDEAIGRANAYAKAERNKRVLAVLRGMGAVATDATLLMLAGDSDPDTTDGRARLDRLREIEPVAFRQLAPDTTTVVLGAVGQAKAGDSYKGRYGDDYAKRVAEGVIRRANGGE